MECWLTGWKRIANYIDSSVKTAKKYYKECEMPVYRGPSNKPCCLPADLDKWLESFNSSGKHTEGYIYFAQIEKTGHIKIGFSSEPQKRIAGIQASCPFKIRLLAICKGTKKDEENYHKRFKKIHVRGEWYEPKKHLLNFINKIANIDNNQTKQH